MQKLRGLFIILVLLVPIMGVSNILSIDTYDEINKNLEKAGIFGAVIDINVRVPIPKHKNPYSSKDIDLWATVIRPSKSKNEKLPTILVAAPYRREICQVLYIPLVSHGYNLMIVDIRGTGSSEGAWVSFDLVEQYDIKYVIDEWIPAQEWSDGKIGMIGPSYLGIIQLLAAGLIDRNEETGEPVHLKAIFPIVPLSDPYKDPIFHGGTLDLEFGLL